MNAEFLNFILQKKLCTVKDKILVTVSGGLDSMVMLHLFRECDFNISQRKWLREICATIGSMN